MHRRSWSCRIKGNTACGAAAAATAAAAALPLQMLDEAGPEHLADVLGPDNMAELLKDILKLGEGGFVFREEGRVFMHSGVGCIVEAGKERFLSCSVAHLAGSAPVRLAFNASLVDGALLFLCCARMLSGWFLPYNPAGDPMNKQIILSIGPQRMAAMLMHLGRTGGVQVGRQPAAWS
jgi:hypothetical protein